MYFFFFVTCNENTYRTHASNKQDSWSALQPPIRISKARSDSSSISVILPWCKNSSIPVPYPLHLAFRVESFFMRKNVSTTWPAVRSFVGRKRNWCDKFCPKQTKSPIVAPSINWDTIHEFPPFSFQVFPPYTEEEWYGDCMRNSNRSVQVFMCL